MADGVDYLNEMCLRFDLLQFASSDDVLEKLPRRAVLHNEVIIMLVVRDVND
jgi:hypothetical protein